MAQTITDLKVGRVINHEGEPFIIVSNSFMRTAQRKPVMRTKLRNLITGRSLEKTFIAGEGFEIANIEKSNAQYIFKDEDNVNFMDNVTFDQFTIPCEMLGDNLNYMKEGETMVVTKYEGKPIGVELPPKVRLKVVDTTPGVKGDTAQGGSKPATMETGAVIQVPLFINEGDFVKINTETHQYSERG